MQAGDDAEIDDAVLARIREICLALPKADEGLLQDRPLFHVRRRRFAIFNGATSPPRRRWLDAGRSLHLLADPSERDALDHDERFSRSPHHGDRGWFAIALHEPALADWEEITELLSSAYAMVVRTT